MMVENDAINRKKKKDSPEPPVILISQIDSESSLESRGSDHNASQLTGDSEHRPLLPTVASLSDLSLIEDSRSGINSTSLTNIDSPSNAEDSSDELNNLLLKFENHIETADPKLSLLDTENHNSPCYAYKKGYRRHGVVRAQTGSEQTSFKSIISHPVFGLAVFFLLSSFFIATLISENVESPVARYPRESEENDRSTETVPTYTTKENQPYECNNLITLLTIALFLHIIPAAWFYRYELYLVRWDHPPPRGNSLRNELPHISPVKEPSFREAAGKDNEKAMPEKVSCGPLIQRWLPFPKDQFKESPNIAYDSDDLRSIDTSTISTQSAPSDYLDSTRSDRTMWDDSDEDVMNLRKNSSGLIVREDVAQDWEAQRDLRGAFLLKDFFTTMGLDQSQAWLKVQGWATEEYNRELRAQEAEDAAAHGGMTRKQRDQKMYARWDKFLQKDAVRIMHKRINNQEFARVILMIEAIDEVQLQKEKRARTPAENVAHYVEESFVGCPEDELAITDIAWKSIDRIDNYIHASAQDKWDHFYRCDPPRHCHDWCRVRMSKDFDDDIDFYDACWVYPWLELFDKVYHKFRNKLICAASPYHKCTVGVLWHWLYENKVKFMLVLNVDVERNLHSSADWYPRKVGETYKCRRNREREYIVRLVEAKKLSNGGGVERKFVVTLIRCNQRIHSKSIKILFMHNWEQDGMVVEWQSYVPILERVTLLSFGRPVVVMSKHGSGRAMTVILSVMAAVMAHYDNDVSIHSMVQAGRASKRQAIVVFNQVYVWRQWHYEMLFKWHMDKILRFRTEMPYRFFMYKKEQQKHLTQFVEEQRHGIWFIHYQYEVARYERFWAYTGYYQAWDLFLEYRERKLECLEEGSHPVHALLVYDYKKKKETAHEYDSLVPIRRRPLRKGDGKRDPKRDKVEFVNRNELSFEEAATFEHFEHLMIPEVWKFKGRNHFMYLKDYKEKRAKGAQFLEAWKTWMDKDGQQGIMKPGDQFSLPWHPKSE